MRTNIVVKSDNVPEDLITLSLPDELHAVMKRHDEVKWNKVVERVILQHIKDLASSDRSNDMLDSTGPPRV
ncbi:MAG: hypothetical protein QGG50_04975 [Methanopyri archaeon]|jgi:hypothetical protein|nr:hypothetical protein [Methanopyri archaeon]